VNRLFSQIFPFTVSFILSVNEAKHLLHSSWSKLVLSCLSSWQHFLKYPSFNAPSPWTSTICLWISNRNRFLHLKIVLLNELHRYQDFRFIFNDYSEWGKTYDTIQSNTCASSQMQKMTGLHRKCAISSDSLDVCHATKWQKWKLKVNLSLPIIKNDAIRACSTDPHTLTSACEWSASHTNCHTNAERTPNSIRQEA
jgi:hypothetical protein